MRALAVVLALALPPAAAADESLVYEPEVAPVTSLGLRLLDKVTLLGDELSLHLSNVSFEMLDVRFDGRRRACHVRFAAGDARAFVLRLQSDVTFEKGFARVIATVGVGIAGHRFDVKLPDFQVVPHRFAGHNYVEVRVPLIEGTF